MSGAAAQAQLRVGFAGTPEFAATALASLLGAGYTIPLVLTQPDRPKGRGLATLPSAVKALADAHGLTVAQPASLKPPGSERIVADARLDVMVVAAYGLILPPAVLAAPRHGCLNIHASLLPRWRGAAPVARAIAAGDRETGVTIMQMDAGLDTGAIVDVGRTPIGAHETAATLTPHLAALGAALVVDVLARLAAGAPLRAVPQPAEGVIYAHKVTRDEASIDWRCDATTVEARIRAFDPWPVAWTTLDGAVVKLWRGEALRAPADASGIAVPGRVLRADARGIDVGCASGILRIHELQPANARRMDAGAYVAGRALAPGTLLGAATPPRAR